MTITSSARRHTSSNYARNPWTAASVFLLLLGLSLLTGCAGLSAGSNTKTSQQQEQLGTISLGSASLDFGSVAAGTAKTLTVTATNSGSATVTVNKPTVSSNYFSVTAPSFPATIAAGQSATLTLAFTPNAAGTFNATATFTSNASDSSVSVPLSGTGVAAGQLTANPSSQNFGSVTVGSQQTASETVTNTGGVSITISQAGISGAGFSLSGISTPATLDAGQSATFSITFAPQSAGTATGKVTLTSDAPNPTLTISLSGDGIGAGQLTSNPSSKAFGNVTLGNQLSASETVTNTGGTSVTISKAAISGTGFSMSGIAAPITLAAGQSTSFSFTFAPQTAGSATGTVTLTSNASNPSLKIALSGTGVAAGQLTANPSSQSFGNVTVSTQQSASETVTNTGGTSVAISQATISGSGFSMSGLTTPKNLAAGQSATFNITFAPQASGSASGTVTLTSNAPNPTLQISLSGTGAAVQAGQLSATPATLALGSVTVGNSGTASGSLTATGGSVTLTAATTNNSAFAVSGISLPATIPAGQSLPFTITFSPQAAGPANATLTITSDAQSPTITESLTGTGTAAPTHSVSLSWSASTSTDVAGYNVYRAVYSGAACGAMAKINSVLNTSTVYSDNTVASSTAYCYATTAVDSSSQESSYSNIVSNVAIP
jgi:HYDIN/CFA65/VesB family protein/ASPM-SPD-2-Hydin domain-containing protein